MKDVNCYMCGSRSCAVLESQNAFPDTYLALIGLDRSDMNRRICVCNDCGFVYRTPILDAADASLLYSDKYRDNILKRGTADDYFDRIVAVPDAESELAAKIDWLGQRLRVRFGHSPALLDVGCGAGMFLYKFLRQFPAWDVAGVEPGALFGETAARRLAKPVAIQNYEPGLFGRRFELITLIQVLEHVESPADLLASVKEDLSVDGVVYIETPSVADFGIVPPGHDRFMIPHLYFFSPNSMRNLCARAGFAVLECELVRTKRGKVDVRALCRHDPAAPDFALLRDDVAQALALRKAFLKPQ